MSHTPTSHAHQNYGCSSLISQNTFAHRHTHTSTKIQTHYFSCTPPHHQQPWGPHSVPHLEQAAVKWGPVWELLAGLVETAKAWSSLALMTLASSSSRGSTLGCCFCYCQEAGKGKVKHDRLRGQGPKHTQFTLPFTAVNQLHLHEAVIL